MEEEVSPCQRRTEEQGWCRVGGGGSEGGGGGVEGGGGWLAGGSQPSAAGVRVGQSQSRGVGSGCCQWSSQKDNSEQVMPTSNGAIKNPHGD